MRRVVVSIAVVCVCVGVCVNASAQQPSQGVGVTVTSAPPSGAAAQPGASSAPAASSAPSSTPSSAAPSDGPVVEGSTQTNPNATGRPLPRTGVNVLAIVLIAMGLLTLGDVLLGIARKRRQPVRVAVRTR